MVEIVSFLHANPGVVWGGLILGTFLFLIHQHLQTQEKEREAPEPDTLENIVKPKVREHLHHRGESPPDDTYFQIGRSNKGEIDRMLETDLPKKLINPNPDNQAKDQTGEETVSVRILSVMPSSKVTRFFQKLLALFTRQKEDRRIYVFREESFIDTPNPNQLILDGDTMSYSYAGMEVELTASARNSVHQAVQTEVSEQLLASLPNYTEKVDFLFPYHSQNVTMEERRNEGEGDWS